MISRYVLSFKNGNDLAVMVSIVFVLDKEEPIVKLNRPYLTRYLARARGILASSLRVEMICICKNKCVIYFDYYK